jgi:outer membrane lipoprotein-sorting protein
MRQQTFALVLSCLLVPAFGGVARAQTADEIVNKHLAAVGGREALSKITTRRATGTVALSSAMGDLRGTIEIIQKTPNKTHTLLQIDLSAMGAPPLRIEQFFDGSSGFVMNSMQGDAEMPARQAENARNNAFPSMLMSYKEKGIALEVLPKSTINGHDAIGLKATPKGGSPIRVYFDAQTYLLLQSVVTIDPGDGNPVEQTSDSSDYRTLDGIKVAFHVVNKNPLQTVTITLEKVEHNVPLDDALFVKK